MGVARQSVADDLGVDARAARLRVLQRFKHDTAGAFAHDETIAVAVVGARALRRAVIEAGGQGAAGRETGDADAVDG